MVNSRNMLRHFPALLSFCHILATATRNFCLRFLTLFRSEYFFPIPARSVPMLLGIFFFFIFLDIFRIWIPALLVPLLLFLAIRLRSFHLLALALQRLRLFDFRIRLRSGITFARMAHATHLRVHEGVFGVLGIACGYDVVSLVLLRVRSRILSVAPVHATEPRAYLLIYRTRTRT